MSTASPFPQLAGSTPRSTTSTPTYFGCTASQAHFDSQDLVRQLRNITPHPDDYVEIWKVETKRDYEKLIALGGRPTRPIRPQFIWKITMKDGMFTYRDEDEDCDVIQEPNVTSEEDGLAFTHWSKESIKWKEELERWQEFREAQRIDDQFDRLETDLELDNTDANLIEVLSKLNDWKEFELFQQKKVHEAETFYAHCQHRMIFYQNAPVDTSGAAESAQYVYEPLIGWLYHMIDGQKSLETAQDELLWVKSQWKEVLAEASHSIGAAQKLQKQLEDKFENQTNAIYRQLLEKGARPSRAVRPPDKNAGFPQRLQHWISESSAFTAELWDWRLFLAWRRSSKNIDATKSEGQKQSSPVNSCLKLSQDFVKYCQYELDKAISWVNCWRCQAREYAEADKDTSLQEKRERPSADEEDDEDLRDARAYAYAEPTSTKAEQAQVFVRRAEVMVSDAAKRLEESKQDLESVLAESTRISTGEVLVEESAIQLLPISPESLSPRRLRKDQRPLKKGEPARIRQRRSRKEGARKRGATMGNTNTKQQGLPTFSISTNQIEEDDDIKMADAPNPDLAGATEKLEGAESEDTIMKDVEDPPIEDPPIDIPPPSSKSHPRPTTNTDTGQRSCSACAQPPTSRKTRSTTTKRNQTVSDKVCKNKGKKPAKNPKVKTFTEQQAKALLGAACVGNCPPANPTPLRRSERLRQRAAARSPA